MTLRPNGSPHPTRIPCIKQTAERKAVLDAASAQAKAINDSAFAEASRALKAGEITAREYAEKLAAAGAQASKLIWEAK